MRQPLAGAIAICGMVLVPLALLASASYLVKSTLGAQ